MSLDVYLVLRIRDAMLNALSVQQAKRHQYDCDGWIAAERKVMLNETNEWRALLGKPAVDVSGRDRCGAERADVRGRCIADHRGTARIVLAERRRSVAAVLGAVRVGAVALVAVRSQTAACRRDLHRAQLPHGLRGKAQPANHALHGRTPNIRSTSQSNAAMRSRSGACGSRITASIRSATLTACSWASAHRSRSGP